MILSEVEKKGLEFQDRTERDSRICDRIKGVLLASEGWSQKEIGQALRIHETTVWEHLNDYMREKKLKPNGGGSTSKLDDDQTKSLISHLESHTYPRTKEIIEYVQKTCDVGYTQQGMHDWLKLHKFSYKKPKGVPAKFNQVKQDVFVKEYEALKENLQADDVVLFMDSVHPTQATKITYGWIRTGVEKMIATVASRSRINLTGALQLSTMAVITREYETINGGSTVEFLKVIEATYPTARKIHIIADGGGAHTSEEVGLFLSHANPVNRVYLEKAYGIRLLGNSITLSKKIKSQLKLALAAEPDLFHTPQILDARLLTARDMLSTLKAPPPHPKMIMHILPPYSPNLNPIERVWKVMNEKVRNNKVFQSFTDFKTQLHTFFDSTCVSVASDLTNRINDNFQTLKPVV